MQKTSYKLTFHEMRSLMLFLRDYNWEIENPDNLVLAKFIYDTCRTKYENLEKRGLRIIANKKMERPFKVSFSDLEMLSISILVKHPHESAHIQMVINKISLDLPIEVINVLKPVNNEESIN